MKFWFILFLLLFPLTVQAYVRPLYSQTAMDGESLFALTPRWGVRHTNIFGLDEYQTYGSVRSEIIIEMSGRLSVGYMNCRWLSPPPYLGPPLNGRIDGKLSFFREDFTPLYVQEQTFWPQEFPFWGSELQELNISFPPGLDVVAGEKLQILFEVWPSWDTIGAFGPAVSGQTISMELLGDLPGEPMGGGAMQSVVPEPSTAGWLALLFLLRRSLAHHRR